MEGKDGEDASHDHLVVKIGGIEHSHPDSIEEDGEDAEDKNATHKTEFFADEREDEVGVLFGNFRFLLTF